MLKFVIQAILMEGVLTEEVDGREGQTTLAQAALHHLEHLGTGRRGGEGGEGKEGRGGEGGRRWRHGLGAREEKTYFVWSFLICSLILEVSSLYCLMDCSS